MYLKSLEITNFRKFGEENNKVEFVVSQVGNDDLTNRVARSTTLVVGKNNAGKTTITKALEKLVKNTITSNDFNFRYLNKLFEQYNDDKYEEFPELTFKAVIAVHSDNSDLIVNVAPFICLSDIDLEEDLIHLNITMKYELKESEQFTNKLKELTNKYKRNKRNFIFSKFLKLIDEVGFSLSYYNTNDELISDNRFKISDLIRLKLISADKNLKDPILSKTFNDIIKTRYKMPTNVKSYEKITKKIDSINTQISTNLETTHNDSINSVIHKIESSEHLGVHLTSDLDFDHLMKNIIKYEYSEKGQVVPEGQFGLGYANLMNIIGEIIDYVEGFPIEDKHDKINIICIEEPENYMHPQMQEQFIKKIDYAVNFLLDSSDKKLNSQLLITTHSSHILNSKIHASKSFNNINYITTSNNNSHVIILNDESVIDGKYYDEKKLSEEERIKQKKNDLKFLKKHIKFKVSDLFFSDAAIIVEGVTEEVLLPYFVEKNSTLSNYHISIFNINGAHGKVYKSLFKLLQVPILLITDIDIKRSKNEKEKSYAQITSLTKRKTTNKTIKSFNDNNDNLISISDYFEDENICCVFQLKMIENQYATSFEEAFILENYENPFLIKVLSELKPQIFKEIVGEEPNQDYKKIINKSFELQRKLSKDKSDFANILLYEMLTEETQKLPNLPEYISDGFIWLEKMLLGGNGVRG